MKQIFISRASITETELRFSSALDTRNNAHTAAVASAQRKKETADR